MTVEDNHLTQIHKCWYMNTWLLRNRFEIREVKLRRRTASGKTIVIPALEKKKMKLIMAQRKLIIGKNILNSIVDSLFG